MAPTAIKNSSRDARELYELKQKAAVYYEKNGVPKKIEEILNDMFYDNPSDVYGHLANYFESFALAPVITKLKGRSVLDSKAQTTLQTDVYCLIKNREKCMASTTVSSENWFQDFHKPEERDEEEKQRIQFVKRAITYISENMTGVLKGISPVDQKEADIRIFQVIDKFIKEEEEKIGKEREGQEPEDVPAEETESQKKLKSPGPKGKGGKAPNVVVVPDEPRETLYCGCNALSSVSRSVCVAAANIRDIPIYEHVAMLKHGEPQQKYHVPQPIVTIFSGGKAAPGKLNCVKDFMVVPRHDMPLSESTHFIASMYNNIAKTLMLKSGVTAKNSNDVGALVMNMDRPEQALDMIQDAITQLELKPGEDFHIILNCAAHECFDYEKGKYEVAGGLLKGFDDMVDFWTELLSRYPSIIGLIDPIRKQEKEQWMSLCDSISEKCFVVGDYVWHRPGLLKDEEVTEDFKSSAVVFRLEQMNQVSDIIQCARKMEECGSQVILSTSQGETDDTFLSDMAVGIDARFIKIGGPTRGERVAKLNRLIQIEDTLREQGMLDKWSQYEFPKISPPPPPEVDPDEAEGDVQVQEDKKDSPAKKK